MKDFITVKINRSELERMLTAMLRNSSEAKTQLLSKVICENIAGTECGLDNLYLALNGVEKTFKYRVGDDIFVHKSHCYSWKTDFDAMVEKNMLINDYVKAEIVSIHPYRNSPYCVKFKYINKENGEVAEVSGAYAQEEEIYINDIYPLED